MWHIQLSDIFFILIISAVIVLISMNLLTCFYFLPALLHCVISTRRTDCFLEKLGTADSIVHIHLRYYGLEFEGQFYTTNLIYFRKSSMHQVNCVTTNLCWCYSLPLPLCLMCERWEILYSCKRYCTSLRKVIDLKEASKELLEFCLGGK